MPSVVFPLSQEGKVEFTAGLVQLPDWHTPVPQKAEPVPHVPFMLQQSPQTPAQRRFPYW